MLKSILQSNIITEKLETLKKPKSFDIESVTIEHPNSATTLSNPVKQPKIINQQPKKEDC